MLEATNRVRVAILDDYQNAALTMADWSTLADRVDVTVFNDHVSDMAALVERLSGFEIVCAMRERTPFPRELFERLPALRLLTTTSWKTANVDMQAASELGIAVAWTEGLAYGAPEITFTLILAALRNLTQEAAAFRNGEWQQTVGRDINGRTLGILGLGKIGKTIARAASVFGMQVIAWSPNIKREEAEQEGVQVVDKDELFARSDVLSVHMVLSERSAGIVGRADIERMKPTAWLVNTSRGPLVDERALIDALVAGRIGGAALDTYSIEPLPPDHLFRRLPNVLGTPHIGFVTEDTYRVFYGQTVENIDGWLRGQPVRTELPRAVTRSS
ncbi:Hydroxyacid dehydrogenase [Paraburkholderia sacchari]|uniref:D-2-hydroxyacid dehydrogenase family protein n=1 Tax=Paraburkholderia sacchari TaxID=159450 RepID=UPI0039A4B86D